MTHPDGTTDTYGLTWDRNRVLPEVVSVTMDGTRSDVVYGAGRAYSVTGGVVSDFGMSVLGDAVSGALTVASSFDPYGNPDTQNQSVGFGYRGELHAGGLVYLRARDLDPTLGRFTTPDPVSGVPGTTTVTNRYHHANNDPVGIEDRSGLRAVDEVFRNRSDAGGVGSVSGGLGSGSSVRGADSGGFTEEELDSLVAESAVVALEIFDSVGNSVVVKVEVVYIRTTDTYLLKLPNGTIRRVAATASRDSQFLSGARIWADDAPAFLRRLDPVNLGRITKGAGILGTVAAVAFVTVDAVEAYRIGGLGELLNVSGRGAAEIGGGLAGAAVVQQLLDQLRTAPHPAIRIGAVLFGAVVGTKVGGELFDLLVTPSDCPSPLFAEYWTHPELWRPECGGPPPPGWIPSA